MVDCSYPGGDGNSGSLVLVWDFGQGRRIRDATLMNDDSPTLAHVFALYEKIELNMVEERVVTSRFSRDTITTSHGQQSIS
jgi:hypothetical protein